MYGISVELGTYSIKFINYQIDKKTTYLINTDEIIIEHDQDKHEQSNEFQLWQIQLRLLREYLDNLDSEYQLMLNMPSQIVTTRYLEFPVKNKKKAIQMLPFQIEEDLPYSLNDCTWAESLIVEEDGTKAMVGIVKDEYFFKFFNSLKENSIAPHILTTDTANFSGLILKHKENFPVAFSILNLGHETTRGFYFKNGKLVSNHLSYIAGDAITRSISQTYSISYDEATIYKHQNSFLLLEDQYDQVNENQKEFAMMMDYTLAMLLSEIKRWDIGYRVKYGESIKEIYICGGTSNIKNMKNYLSAKLNVEVHFLNPYTFMDATKIDEDEKLRRKFTQVASLCANAINRSNMINFLKGDYALASGIGLPVESFVFLSTRLGIFALFICIYLFAESLILSGKLNNSNKNIVNLTKNPIIAGHFTNRDTRLISSNKAAYKQLVQMHANLVEKDNLIEQEVRTIQSALSTNGLNSLLYTLSLIGGRNVEILKFVSSDSENIDLSLHSDDINELESIKTSLDNDKTQKWFIDLNKKDQTLTIAGKRPKL